MHSLSLGRSIALIIASAVLAIACSTAPTATPAPPARAPIAAEPTTTTAAPADAPAPTVAAPAPNPADTAAPVEAAATAAPTPAPTDAPAPTAAPAASAAVGLVKVNLNTATRDQILAIPNTGRRMVREFEEYRPYNSILQFRREIGKYVDDAQVAEYEIYVYVPIAPNEADEATLQQLPGVNAAIAEQLIAARPFASRDAFLEKLAQLTSQEQANAGADWVEAP
jgi:DNA uptake protein ComE-like DNA-binding protein